MMDRRSALKKTGVLAGVAVAMPSLFSLLESCKTEQRMDWNPLFFTTTEAGTISSLLDTILPRTNTPGALDVKADMFIDKVIAMTYEPEGQQHMRAQLEAFNASCVKAYGAIFQDLDNSKKTLVLEAEERTSGKFNPGVWGTTVGKQEPIGFYRAMKSMAIWAYFTSEQIGEEVLSYDPIPGNYEGCKPLAEVGNRWSL